MRRGGDHYRTLQKTGLIHDEGPDKTAAVVRMYRASVRRPAIYMEYAKKLIEKERHITASAIKSVWIPCARRWRGKEIMMYDKH